MSAAIRSIIRRIGAGDGFDNTTDYPDSTLDLWIADAYEDVPESKIRAEKRDRAIAYYAAHLMYETYEQGGSGGGIKKEKTRNVEIEYHDAGSEGHDFDNKYYKQYLKFIGPGCRPSPMVLNRRSP